MNPALLQRLLAAEASAAKSRALLEELGSLDSESALQALVTHPLLADGERRRAESADMDALSRVLQADVQLLTGDALPEELRNLPGTPVALFVDGNSQVLNQPTVAIVGTRSATTYGKACALKFAEAFARAGVTVISGGALGIDASAHRGALAAGGVTAAVFASGIDRIYPAVHAGLFREIAGRGCLVSQFAAGTKPGDYRFLVRNALVAALSQAVVVIEAPLKSGAMRTAHYAAEYGREVFVVPANIDLLSFQGSFSLIRDGASLVSHPSEVLEALRMETGPEEAKPSESGPLLGLLSSTPLPTEKIVELSGLPTADVLAELTMLELEGRVIRDASGYSLRP